MVNSLIFLDFDGVIVPDGAFRGRDNNGTEFDKNAISKVNTLCYEAHAGIVVTSMWRTHHTKEDIERWLRDSGLTAPILGQTVNIDYRARAMEIGLFLKFKRGYRYVVLDDDTYARNGHESHFVLIDKARLVTDSDVRKALSILASGPA
jgi:hypothetical protein